jgi:hypothetical protein
MDMDADSDPEETYMRLSLVFDPSLPLALGALYLRI